MKKILAFAAALLMVNANTTLYEDYEAKIQASIQQEQLTQSTSRYMGCNTNDDCTKIKKKACCAEVVTEKKNDKNETVTETFNACGIRDKVTATSAKPPAPIKSIHCKDDSDHKSDDTTKTDDTNKTDTKPTTLDTKPAEEQWFINYGKHILHLLTNNHIFMHA